MDASNTSCCFGLRNEAISPRDRLARRESSSMLSLDLVELCVGVYVACGFSLEDLDMVALVVMGL